MKIGHLQPLDCRFGLGAITAAFEEHLSEQRPGIGCRPVFANHHAKRRGLDTQQVSNRLSMHAHTHSLTRTQRSTQQHSTQQCSTPE